MQHIFFTDPTVYLGAIELLKIRYRECDLTKLCDLVGNHELYFKLSLAYKAIASAVNQTGVKVKNVGTKFALHMRKHLQ